MPCFQSIKWLKILRLLCKNRDCRKTRHPDRLKLQIQQCYIHRGCAQFGTTSMDVSDFRTTSGDSPFPVYFKYSILKGRKSGDDDKQDRTRRFSQSFSASFPILKQVLLYLKAMVKKATSIATPVLPNIGFPPLEKMGFKHIADSAFAGWTGTRSRLITGTRLYSPQSVPQSYEFFLYLPVFSTAGNDHSPRYVHSDYRYWVTRLYFLLAEMLLTKR